MATPERIAQPARPVQEPECWRKLEPLLYTPDRLIVLARETERIGVRALCRRGQRIELDCLTGVRDCGVHPAGVVQQFAVPLMRSGVTWVCRERHAILLLGAGIVPGVNRRQTKRGVCLGESAVECNRAARRVTRALESIGRGGIGVFGKKRVRAGDSRIRAAVTRVGVDRLLEVCDCSPQIFAAASVPEVQSAKVEVVRLEILRPSRGRGYPRGRRPEPELQCVGDVPGDVVLHLEYVLDFPLVGVGPECQAVRDARELSTNPQLVAGASD